MQFLSKKECRKWCQNNHIALDSRDHPAITAAKGGNEFAIPADAGQRVALVRQHMAAFEQRKTLAWITGWGIWPSSERYHIFERLRLSHGCTQSLADLPGQIFGAEEYEDLLSYVTLSVMFLWDCYVLTPFGKPARFFSHDEYVIKA